jgi:hypothetical protein
MVDSANVYRPPRDIVVGAPDLLDFLTNPGFVGTPYYLDPTNGNDGNSGLSPDDAFATLPTAYAAIPANQHNVLYYMSGTSSISLSAAFTWAKSYTHFVGIGAAPGVANRARIFQAAAATGLSPLFTVSASGCIFANIYTFQGVNDATSLINWLVTGGRNVFWNMHFAGGGHATMAINGAASLKLDGAEENRFVNCTIGVDTISAATGVTGMLLDSEAHRNKFEDCFFTLYAGNANVFHVESVDLTGFDRYTTFRNTLFSNTASTSMDTVFEIPAGVGAPRTFYLYGGTMMHGADDWDDNDRGVVFLDVGTITAGGNAGIMQATNST